MIGASFFEILQPTHFMSEISFFPVLLDVRFYMAQKNLSEKKLKSTILKILKIFHVVDHEFKFEISPVI